jgi:hypothetical protein
LNSSLSFRPDGRFLIAQFTDLHWHNGEEPDAKTRRMMERVLDAERPDLVALTGDVIAGSGCKDPAESVRQAVAPMEERGIPWAAVFGNHDDEGSLDRRALMAVQRSCPMSLSQPGPEEVSGVGNYALPVRSSRSEALAAALYFMDSRSYSVLDGLDGYGWFEPDQIEWYRRTSQALRERYARERDGDAEGAARLPALAFFHIPLPEYNEVWDFHPCRGYKFEDVCCPRINTGMFAAMLRSGDVMGTFVGHDHVNDYEGDLYGIRLCYGRWSGYHTYGLDRLIPGARMIELKEGERGFKTWMRADDENLPLEQAPHEPQGRVKSGD